MIDEQTAESFKTFVNKQLAQLTSFLQNDAKGDFKKHIPLPEEENEFTELFVAMNRMVDEFRVLGEEKFRGLVEGMNEAIYRMSLPDGKYSYVSPAIEKVFGFKADDFLNNPVLMREMIHPEFQENFKKQWDSLTRGIVPPNYEYKILDPKGEPRWIFQSNRALFDETGRITGIEGLCRDVTERKRTEESGQFELQFKSLLQKVTVDLIGLSPEKTDKGIEKALEEIAQTVGAVRATIFVLSEDLETITNTHEWCAVKKDSQKASLQGIPFSMFGYYRKVLLEKKDVAIGRLADLPEKEAKGERQWIKQHGFRSLYFVPMELGDRLYGTIGFYGDLNVEHAWPDRISVLLRILQATFVNILQRKTDQEELANHRYQLEAMVQSRTADLAAEKDFSDHLINSLPGIFYMFDKKLHFTRWNKNLERVTGYTAEEMRTISPLDLFTGKTKWLIASRIGEVFKTGESTAEGDFVTKTGERIPYHFTGKMIRKGRSPYLIGMGLDISKRKKVEAEREKLIADMRERVKEMRCINEINDILKNTELPLERMLEDIVDHIPHGWVYPDITQCRIRVGNVQVKSKKYRKSPYSMTTQLQLNGEYTGEIEVSHRRKMPERDVGSFLTEEKELLGTITDVTERAIARRQAEEAIRESEAAYRALTDNLPGMVYRLHLKEGGRMQFFNEMTLEMTGYLPEELSHGEVCSIDALMFAEDREKVVAEVKDAIKNRAHFEVEYRLKHKDGRIRYFNERGRVIEVAGEANFIDGLIFDVSEHREAEIKLKEQYQQFLQMLENFPEVLYVADPEDCTVLFVNRVFADALGGDPTGQKCFKAFHGLKEPCGFCTNAILAETREPYTWEYHNPLIDRDYIITDQLIPWSDGRDVRFEVAIDISDRKRAEERIIKLNQLKEGLLGVGAIREKMQHITDTVVNMLGADFARIWISQAGDLCDQGCIHAEATEGPHVCTRREQCLHLMASSGRYTHIDGEGHRRVPFGCYKIGRVAASEEPGFLTNEVKTDSRVHNHEWAKELDLVSFAGYQLTSDSGTPIGVLALFSKKPISSSEEALIKTIAGTASQVIQVSKSLQALTESEGRFRSIFEDSPISLWEEDFSQVKTLLDQIYPNGNGELRGYLQDHPDQLIQCVRAVKVLNLNKATLDIFQAENREDLIQGIDRIFTDNALEIFLEELAVFSEGGNHFEGEAIQRTLKGDQIWTHVSATLAPGYEKNWQKVFVSIMDITGRKQAEKKIQKALDDLARSNKELEQFAYVASHDLQEPLRKIRAFGDRLSGKYEAVLDERGNDYLGRMLDAASRSQTLISDLLTFSRIATRGETFEQIDLNDILKITINDLELRIQDVNALIVVNNLPVIEADPTQMRQLFQNLIGNALKFHREGEKTIIRIQGRRHGDQTEICVHDNGIGFDPQFADRIFVIFQRLHGRAEYEGTGIGLAICKRIVERHGGSIIAESQPDSGATFKLTLPYKQAHGITDELQHIGSLS